VEENNFNSDEVKRRCFLPTNHILTPHKKRKKCKTKFYTLPHETTLQKKRLHDGARKRRERREKKKEEGRISSSLGGTLGLAGRISSLL
jgi:TFIIF-interacting CTD phosphatase-like protein